MQSAESSPRSGGRPRSFLALACLAGLATGCGESAAPAEGDAVTSQEREALAELGYARLSPAESAAVSGRVVDPAGQPLAHFKVRALQLEHVNLPQSVGAQEVQRSRDGAFELVGLQPGRMLIEARAPGFAASFSAPLETTAGSVSKDVEVRMTLGGTLTGRVIDAHTADAIPGAEVRVFDAYEELFGPLDAWEAHRSLTRTDEEGHFVLEHVPAGDSSLRVQCAGYALLAVSDVHTEEGQTRELPLLALAQGATVAGVVHGLDGAPLPDASVQVSPSDAEHMYGNRIARTDAAGRFRIEHVVPGTYQLSATRPDAPKLDPFAAIEDMRRSQTEIVVAEQQSYEFTLRLAKPR